MPLPSITPLPTPPSRSDSANFASRGDAFLGALPTFQSQMNALAAAVDELYFPQVFRNHLINGDFSIWDEGTTQTTSGYGSDQMWINVHAGSTKTASREEFSVYFGDSAALGFPRFFSRTIVSSVAGASNFVTKTQRIEGLRALAGRTVTLSFWAKADAAKPIAIELLQNYGLGTGGSPDRVMIGARKVFLTTAWTRYEFTISVPTIVGNTLASNGGEYTELVFWFDAGSNYLGRSSELGQQSGTFDLANVQLEIGSAATSFELRPPAVERSLVDRFYESGTVRVACPATAYVGQTTRFRATKPRVGVGRITSLTGTPSQISYWTGSQQQSLAPSGGSVMNIALDEFHTDAIVSPNGSSVNSWAGFNWVVDARL